MKVFPRHIERTVHRLHGVWDFAFLGEAVRLEKLDPQSITFDETMSVPSAIDASPAYAAKRGTFAYRTQVRITRGHASRIRFHGLGMWCRVVVDGEALEECSLPYTGFWVDLSLSENEWRELIVVIDNRFDKARVPLQEQYFDFYAYGGIFREVEWHEFDKYCIDRVRVNAADDVVEAEIIFHGEVPEAVDLWLSVDGQEELAFPDVGIQDGKTSLTLRPPGLAGWSPEEPNLHTLRVRTDHDDIIERFGIRTVSIQDGRIAVNGKVVKLRGCCRHEAHPQFGPALPHQQLVHDLQLLKDLGCNFVRGAHYPQDQRFLDLCDEVGLLVMEEGLSWGATVESLSNPIYCALQEQETRMMVRNSINHPSIILWGYQNEGASHTEESRSLYQRLSSCIKEEDDTRLTAFGSHHPFDDLNFGTADVIGLNVYPGWYFCNEDVAPHDKIVPHIRSVLESVAQRGFGDKPVIVTEIGAGAIYGWRDTHRAHWSEQYQADYLGVVCQEVMTNPKLSGVSIWQFCDCRTFSSGMALRRPRAFNNKGILDEYRRPKLSYEVVKRAFHSACE